MFVDILQKKKRFLDYKNKEFKILKSWDFPKGLVHGFGQKIEKFPCFCLWQNRPGKCVRRYSRKNTNFSRP